MYVCAVKPTLLQQRPGVIRTPRMMPNCRCWSLVNRFIVIGRSHIVDFYSYGVGMFLTTSHRHTTTLSQLPCHFYHTITTTTTISLPPLLYHHYHITTPLSPLPYHPYHHHHHFLITFPVSPLLQPVIPPPLSTRFFTHHLPLPVHRICH